MQEDQIKIAVATDIHLGYKENHIIRGNDSFVAFDQVCQISLQEKVDFLLLGGDLFDVIQPSQNTLIKCMSILKKYVFGQNSTSMMMKGTIQANFQNKNLNISLPIFTIHGNHDYPANINGNSICDLLHSSYFANYFGKLTNYEQKVIPLEFYKGGTNVAVYGIGYVKDVKLHRLFQEKKIKLQQPIHGFHNYFNILIIHQNRYNRNSSSGPSYKECIHQKYFPNQINLIIWCHQHQSIKRIQKSYQIDIEIFQPGSTIITSLKEAQVPIKQTGIFIISKNKYEYYPRLLEKSYRPLIYENVRLDDLIIQYKNKEDKKKPINILDCLQLKAQQLVSNYEKNDNPLYFDCKKNKKKPLLRIKIEYGDYDIPRFLQRVANPDSIFKFFKMRKRNNQIKNLGKQNNLKNSQIINTQKEVQITLQRFFKQELIKKQQFKLLNPQKLFKQIGNRKSVIQTYIGTKQKLIQNQISNILLAKSNLINKNYNQIINQVQKKQFDNMFITQFLHNSQNFIETLEKKIQKEMEKYSERKDIYQFIDYEQKVQQNVYQIKKKKNKEGQYNLVNMFQNTKKQLNIKKKYVKRK